MKTFLTAACALVAGAAAGAFCMHAYDAKELYTQTLAGIQQVGQERATCIALNLAVLEQIEANGGESAKSFLARIVASYYRAFHDFQPMSAETRQFMQRIETASEKSPALQEALKTPPK